MCHLVLGLPLIGLAFFLFLPLRIALPAYLFVLVLTGWLYVKVFRAMKRAVLTGREGLIGEEGVARTDIAPEGTVFCRGELWNAVAQDGHIAAGEWVRVVGVEGLRLHVERTSHRR